MEMDQILRTVSGVRWLRRGAVKYLCAGALTAGSVLAVANAASSAPNPSAQRGSVIQDERVESLTASQVAAGLAGTRFGDSGVRYGVDVYRVVYRTIDAHATPTSASGLVVLPRGGPARPPVIDYEHGTMVPADDAATVDPTSADRAAAVLFSSGGFAVAAPDYLGLGSGPGYHPYMDVRTEVSATVDLLRATRVVAADRHRGLGSRLLVTGFSQGGAAAMAVGRAVQDGEAPRFSLAAVAGISGPYDVWHAEIPAALVTGRLAPTSAAFYLAYWTVSMNRLYHLYGSPSEVFNAPYDGTVPRLFDGRHSDAQINAGLPASPQALLTPRYRTRLLHPTGALLAAIRDNDITCEWHPDAPVTLFYADDDTDVAPADTAHCARELVQHGARPSVKDEGATDHDGSAFRAVPRILAWFTRLTDA